MYCFKKDHNKCKGFSITEMSVVLVSVTAIIILSIGGTTLIKNNRISNIYNDVNKFSLAIEKFEQRYGALPGDIADTSTLDSSTPGNGNGIIDNNEAISLWNHLSIAGLLDNNYDGTSDDEPGKGVPKSDVEGGGYNIKIATDVTATSVPSQTIVIELAGFATGNNQMPILSAQDSKAIDDKLDDGNPTTGYILAEGNNNDCVTATGDYNLTSSNSVCRVLFLTRLTAKEDDSDIITGACSQIGQTRQINDANEVCPEGYEGTIIQTCRVDLENVGSWEVTDKVCSEVRCSDGGMFGDTRKMSCINGMKGTKGITQQCSKTGVWKVVDSDCEHPTSLSCANINEVRTAQACGWGETGRLLQTCIQNNWDLDAPADNTCTEILCGSNNVGEARQAPIGSLCGDDYSGRPQQVCTIAGTWEITSIGSTCAPDYGSCNADTDDTQNIGCPAGKAGEHTLKCIENGSNDYWTTLNDTCEPIKCGGVYNIGESRIKEGVRCPGNTNGIVMEYCKINSSGTQGEWEEVYTNCIVDICDKPTDNTGNAIWPVTVAGQEAQFTECIDGYEAVSGTPRRQCIDNGGVATWSDSVTDACTRIQCTDPFNNAIYPITNAGETAVVADSCDTSSGYFKPSAYYPIADCKMDGQWDNEKFPCVQLCTGNDSVLPVSGASLWLDADDDCTVLKDNSCSTPSEIGSDPVRCWTDKSGNDFHATGSAQLYEDFSGYKGVYMANGYLSNSDFSIGNDVSTFIVSTPMAFHFNRTMISNPTCRLIMGTFFDGFFSDTRGSVHSGAAAQGLTLNDFYLFTSVLDGVTSFPFVNGEDAVSRPYTDGGNSSGYWLSRNVCGGNAQPWQGSLSEVVIYDNDVSFVERIQTEKYLGDKWDINIYSPIGTPLLWLDANDANTVFSDDACTTPSVYSPDTGDTDRVGCWKDKSGNGYDATVSGADSKPNYFSGGPNGNSYIRFNYEGGGNNDWMHNTSLPSDSSISIFLVGSIKDSVETFITNDQGFHFIALSNIFNSYYEGGYNQYNNHGSDDSTLNVDEFYVLTSIMDGSTNYPFINGVDVGSRSDSLAPFTNGYVLGQNGCCAGNNDFHGNIGEVILYDSAASPTDQQAVEEYLGEKWGITIP
jgi:hypothetical protein